MDITNKNRKHSQAKRFKSTNLYTLADFGDYYYLSGSEIGDFEDWVDDNDKGRAHTIEVWEKLFNTFEKDPKAPKKYREFISINRKYLRESDDLFDIFYDDFDNLILSLRAKGFRDVSIQVKKAFGILSEDGDSKPKTLRISDTIDALYKAEDLLETKGDHDDVLSSLKSLLKKLRSYQKSLGESRTINKKSIREDKKELKEDIDYDLLLNAFTTNLDSAGIEYQADDDKIYYVNNSDKVKEIAQRVCDEFNDYAKPVFSDPNSRKFYQWVTFTDNDEPIKDGEGSGELTDYQKSIIEDMAKNDYEVGHPLSPDEALDWFSSGDEEDIPVDLAQEAADYYFEVFDQVREDNNSDYDENLNESKIRESDIDDDDEDRLIEFDNELDKLALDYGFTGKNDPNFWDMLENNDRWNGYSE